MLDKCRELLSDLKNAVQGTNIKVHKKYFLEIKANKSIVNTFHISRTKETDLYIVWLPISRQVSVRIVVFS